MRARMEEQNRLRAEAERSAKVQQAEQKMTFHRQQQEKQAQSEEMKIMQHQQQVALKTVLLMSNLTLISDFCIPLPS